MRYILKRKACRVLAYDSFHNQDCDNERNERCINRDDTEFINVKDERETVHPYIKDQFNEVIQNS